VKKHAVTEDEVFGEAAIEQSHRTVAGIEVVEYTRDEENRNESSPFLGAGLPEQLPCESGPDQSLDQLSGRLAQLEHECSRLRDQLHQVRREADERIRGYDKRIATLLSHINQRDYELLEKDSKIATLTLAQAGSSATVADDLGPDERPVVADAAHERKDDIVDRLREHIDVRGRALVIAREKFDELERERDSLAEALAERGQQVAQLLAQVTRVEVSRGFGMDFRSGLRRLFHLDPVVATGDADAQSGDWQAGEEPTVVLEESPKSKPGNSPPTAGRPIEGGRAGDEAKTVAVKLRRYLLPLKPDVDPVFELSGPRTYVGRGAEADVCISQPTVSRLHGVFYYIGGATIVEDARSSNGIFVNKHRVQQSVLKDGDVVSFGDAAFRFRVVASE